MTDDNQPKRAEPPASREPLIVEVPTVLTRIDAQLKAQGTSTTTSCSPNGSASNEQQRA